MNNFELTRRYWDWAVKNPDKAKPIYAALFLYAVEKCVRLGWKEKFGLPTELAKEAIGVKNYKTYIEALKFLVDEGFIIMYQKSKNQYTANIIGLVNFTKAHTEAHGKALYSHVEKQVQSTVSINNDYNDSNELNDFNAPTLADVVDYAKEYSGVMNFDLQSTVDAAKKGYTHYSNSGWRDKGGNKINNWKNILTASFLREDIIPKKKSDRISV